MKSTSGNATPTSPASSTSSGGKMIAVRVQMLDDSITLFHIQAKVPGRVLFDQVCKQLNLLEVDYFGLEYEDTHGVMYWLDLEKQMNHQVGLTSSEPLLRFCVKFYTPDPTQIEEEYTRYLFTLQVKRDLGLGLLQCNDNTAALMASYIVQAECGDYVVEDYPDHTYLSSFKFVPQQNQELERKIMENHKRHIGQNPAEADLNLLETGRRCELYGIKMHSAKDHEGVTLELSVAHIGVVVFQNQAKINTFSWAKIRKLSFKRKKFLIKLHPEGYPEGYYKDTVEFYFEDRNHCKNFWKKCVEHHSFFRCSTTIHREREKRRLLSRGSSFRYSGKTQKEMQEFVRENFVQRQSFQRHVRNLHSSMGNVGTSISAQPLLPIGDNGVVGQAFSMSCGEMFNPSKSQPVVRDPGFPFNLPDQDHNVYEPYRPQHQSAHSTPRRALHTASFGYATMGSPYDRSQIRYHAPPQTGTFDNASGYRHSVHGELFSTSVDSADGTSCSGTDNRSENTVVEKEERNEMARRLSNRSNNSRSQVSIHSGHSGGSGYMSHPIHDFDLAREDSHMSSEDNLSHESYELIEKPETDNSIQDEVIQSAPHMSTETNQFEREFYRQATAPIVPAHSCDQASRSSKMSLNSSCSIVTPPPPMPTLHHPIYQTDDTIVPIMKPLIRRKSSTPTVKSNSQLTPSRAGSSKNLAHDIVRTPQMTPELVPIPTLMNTQVRVAQEQQHPCHTLPRMINPRVSGSLRHVPENEHFILQQEQQQQQQQQLPPGNPNQKFFQFSSRTLPNRRREKSPIYFTRGRIGDCSSASSSSHASPKVHRPKSLEFAVVSANALPSKTAYSYQDDTLEQPPQMEYDDSSSAISGMNELNYASSSDVPQTPEMPTVQFPGLRPNMYYEERIYDVPEGIEGVHPSEVTLGSTANPLPPPLPRSQPPPLPAHQSFLPRVEIDNRKFQVFMSQQQRPPFKPLSIPTPPRTLLPTMSSTESESAISARSAPTPVGGIVEDTPNQMHNPSNVMLTFSNTVVMSPDDYSGKDALPGLISPPEESDSTAVIESDNVPDPPPEFSGAGIMSAENSQEDTDVEEEEGTLSGSKIHEVNPEESPSTVDNDYTNKQEKIEREDQCAFTTKDDGETMVCSTDPTDDFGSCVITMNSPPTVFGEDESTDPNDVVRIAEMYVRLGNGSTVSSNGAESDSVPYIDDDLNSSLGERTSKNALDVQEPMTVPAALPQHSSEDRESSEGSLDIASIPPPANAQTEKEAAPSDSRPQVVRALSRISENSFSDAGPPKPLSEGDDDDDDNEEEEEEEHEDTLSEPNCTTTNSDYENPPSLNSDLPDNAASHSCSHPPLTAREVVRECGMELGAEIEFPSPPSSLIEGNHTEFTQIEPDSMFLEITPPEFEEVGDDVASPTGANDSRHSLPKEKIPYDLSISSENNMTRGEDSESSLHDSMEILEEVATVGHFERESQSEAGSEIDDERDIFEMPRLPSFIHVDESESSQETVLEPVVTEEIIF